MTANGGAKQPKVANVIPFDDGDELDVPGRLRAIHPPATLDASTMYFGRGTPSTAGPCAIVAEARAKR